MDIPKNTYYWRMIQEGQLLLKPDGHRIGFRQHIPSSILIWPSDTQPGVKNTIITDPYFSDKSYPNAIQMINSMNISQEQIGYIFITHPHADHFLRFPPDIEAVQYKPFAIAQAEGVFPGIELMPLPGHHPELQAMVFFAKSGEKIGVVGDAILDEEWLLSWQYYWPNGYTESDVMETWASVARIIEQIDLIIPGHGKPIVVSSELVRHLLSSFHHTPYADKCPQVVIMLRKRLEILQQTQ